MVRMRFILPYEPFRATCGTIALIIWPSPRAGKMKPILCSDWLPERGRSAYLARLVFPPLVPQEKVLFTNPLLAKLVRSTWTSTSCRSKNTQKRTSPVQVEPSWLRAWSVTILICIVIKTIIMRSVLIKPLPLTSCPMSPFRTTYSLERK